MKCIQNVPPKRIARRLERWRIPINEFIIQSSTTEENPFYASAIINATCRQSSKQKFKSIWLSLSGDPWSTVCKQTLTGLQERHTLTQSNLEADLARTARLDKGDYPLGGGLGQGHYTCVCACVIVYVCVCLCASVAWKLCDDSCQQGWRIRGIFWVGLSDRKSVV